MTRDIEPVFAAIAALLLRCPDGDDGTLRPLMQAVVTQAKLAGLRAEMLLRLVKESWRSLPAPMSTEGRMRHFEVLDRVVSLCIREFYRDGR